jgi:hypothetical protein
VAEAASGDASGQPATTTIMTTMMMMMTNWTTPPPHGRLRAAVVEAEAAVAMAIVNACIRGLASAIRHSIRPWMMMLTLTVWTEMPTEMRGQLRIPTLTMKLMRRMAAVVAVAVDSRNRRTGDGSAAAADSSGCRWWCGSRNRGDRPGSGAGEQAS